MAQHNNRASSSTAWFRLTVALLTCLLLAACSDSNDSYRPDPPQPRLQELRLSPATAQLPAGLTTQYTATGVFSDGSEQDLSTSVSWETADPVLASVDQTGLATGLAPGETEVIARRDGVQGSAGLTVTAAELVSVGVYPPAAALKKGATQDYRAFAIYTDGSLENVTFDASWSLQNDSGILAAYEPLLTRGLQGLDDFATAIAVEVGSDVLVASLETAAAVAVAAEAVSRSPSVGTSAVSVTESPLLSLRVAPRSESTLVGGSIQYRATGLYADGSAADLTKVVAWSSSNSAVITISNSPGERGLARAQAAGEAEISADYQGLSDRTDVEVIDTAGNPVTKIDVFPPQQSLVAGGSQQFTAIAYLADGRSVDVTRDSQWGSSDEAVAVVGTEGATIGLALALAPGQTEIDAGFAGRSGSAALEVRAPGEGGLEQIIVEPLDSVLQSFTTQQFTAIGIYQDGSKRDITGEVIWDSEDAAVIQVSNADEFGRGLSLALAPGETRVIASQGAGAERVQGAAPVTVIEAEEIPARLIVSPASARAIVGDNQQFEATLVLDSGFTENITQSVAWSSSEPSVAQIDDGGLATAELPGNAGISARLVLAGQVLTGSAALEVEEETVIIRELLVDPPLAETLVGGNQPYSARVVLSDGTSVDVSDAVDWSSSDSGVAQVDTKGIAIGVAAGQASILALLQYLDEIFTGEALLTVKPADVEIRELVVSPGSAEVLVGGTQAFRATAILTDGGRVDVTADASWTSADPLVALVNSRGKASGVAAGQTQVTARLLFNGDSYAASAGLSVVERSVASLEIVPSATRIIEGTTLQLTAQARLFDGGVEDVTSESAWTSSNPEVAHVDSGGLVTGTGKGLATISAAYNYFGIIYRAEALIDVEAADLEVVTVRVTPDPASVAVGFGQQFRAKALFSDGRTQNVSAETDWSSSDSDIAQVSDSGRATGKSSGETVITGTYVFRDKAVSDTSNLSVFSKSIEALSVSPVSATVLVGEQLQYQARLLFKDGSELDVTEDATWRSRDSAVASVDPFSGLAVGEAAGSSAIEAEIVFDGESWQSFGTIAVVDSSGGIVELIVEPPSASVRVDGSQQFGATAVFADGTTEDVSSVVSWASSDSQVAWVDATGLASGVAPGKAEITAVLVDEGQRLSGLGRLSVDPPDLVVTEIQVSPPVAETLVGGKQQYAATARLSDGSERDVSSDAFWSSSDQSIATIGERGRATGVAEGAVVIHASYSDVSGTFDAEADLTVIPEAVTIESIFVDPVIADLLIGGLQQFTATALLSDGNSVDVSGDVSWQSSDVAVAHVDAGGLATGLAEGRSEISATLLYQGESFTGSGRLTVNAPELGIREIQVTPGAAELLVGGKQQYTALAILTDGSSQDVTAESSWTSSDSAVATINSQARATAVAAGTAEIRASLSYQDVVYQGSAVLDVKAPEVGIDSLVVEPPSSEILVGSSQAYSARVVLTDGSDHDVSDRVSWTSSDPAVAEIDVAGTAYGVGGGRAEISALLVHEGDSYTDSARLTVKPPAVEIESLQVDPVTAEVPIDGKQQYTATVLLSDGDRLDVTGDVTWSSSDPATASINALGRATGIASGAAELVASLQYEGEQFTDSGELTVKAAPVTVTGLVVDPPTAETLVGATASFSATALFSDGSSLPVTDDAVWTSSDSAVAAIEAAGLALGTGPGRAEIAASVEYAGVVVSDSARLTVDPEDVTVEDFVVAPASAEILIDDAQQYTATALLSDGSEIDVTRDATWSSADTAVAEVTASGRATGIGEGGTAIRASILHDGISWQAAAGLQVKAPDVTIEEIRVEPALASLLVGGEQAYLATAVLSDGDELDVSDQVAWRSSLPGVASIDIAGVATGHAQGETAISATLDYLGETYSGDAALRVKPAAVTVEELRVSPPQASILVDEKLQYSATALLSDGSELPVTGDVTWSSADSAVAQVNSLGRASGLSEGETAITATLNYEGGQVSDSAGLTVNAIPLVEVVVAPAAASVPAGVAQQFTATAIYQDGSSQDVTGLSYWESSEESVASIDQQGLASTVAAGDTRVSANYEGVSGDAQLTVTDRLAEQLQIIPPFVEGPAGTTGPLLVLARFSDQSIEIVTAEASWRSDDTGVVTIAQSPAARVVEYRLQGAGSASVSASYAGLESTIPVTVSDPELVSIEVSPNQLALAAGLEANFIATGFYSDGSSATLTDEASWSSSDSAVSEIIEPGLARGLAPGSAVITAAYLGISGEALHEVTAAALNELVITPPEWSDAAGTRHQFRVDALYSDGSSEDVTAEAQWNSSNEAVASVTSGGETPGLVSLISPGSASISAALEGALDTASVLVTEPTVVGLRLEPFDGSFPEQFRVQFKAIASYSDGSQSDVTEEAVWSSADPAVAVTGLAGEVYTLAPGTTSINASFDLSASAPITVTRAQVVALQVIPGAVDDPAGSRLQLDARAFYDNGQSQAVTTLATWSSADETVATVIAEGAQAGFSELRSVGETTITAVYDGVSRAVPVTVSEAVLVDLEVQPASAELALGLSQQFEAIGIYSDGSSGPLFSQGGRLGQRRLTGEVTWSSSDGEVASISQDGLAQTLGEGVAGIRADFDGLFDSAEMRVNAAVVSALSVTPFFNSGPAGTTTPLQATATFSDGSIEDVTDEVNWSSAEPSIATVAGDGLLSFIGVAADGANRTTVKALLGGVSGSAVAESTAAVLQSIVLTPNPVSLRVGDSTTVTATGTYSDGSTSGLNEEADWTVDDPAVATVDEVGVVTGVATGTGNVFAAVGDVSAAAAIEVAAPELTAIQITPAAVTGPAGVDIRLKATGYYSDGSSDDISAQVTWVSEDPAVARIGNGASEGGLLQLLAQGNTRVSASLDGREDRVEVEVTAAVLVDIRVAPDARSIPRGTTQQYQATLIYSDDSFETAEQAPGLRWASANPLVATIDQQGLATGVRFFPGQAGEETTIQASLDGLSSNEARLTVTEAVPLALAVTPTGLEEPAGSTVQLKATATYTDSTDRDVTGKSSWVSSDTATVLVYNGDSPGRADLLAVGQAEVKANFQGLSDSTLVRVSEARLLEILVLPPVAEIGAGLELAYRAQGLYSDDTERDITAEATWQSSDTGVATIDAAGLATAVAEGSAVIVARLDELAGEASLTVSPALVTSLDIVPALPQTLQVGQQQHYRAFAGYSDGSSADVTGQVYWSVDPPALATFLADTAGHLEALEVGEGRVSALLEETPARGAAAGSRVEADVALNVEQAGVVAVEINTFRAEQQPLPMPAGSSEEWQGLATLSNGETVDITATAYWKSSDDEIVSVSVADGSDLALVSALSPGEATISMDYLDPGSGEVFVDTVDVAVAPAPLESIVVAPAEATTGVGGVVEYAAIGQYADGSSSDVTSEASWRSADTSVAVVVDGRALGLAPSPGAAITARLDGLEGAAVIRVIGRTLVGITVEVDNLSFGAGSTYAYVALASYSDGSTENVTAVVDWSSSDESVAVVANFDDGDIDKGLASLLSPGNTVISAQADGVVGSANLEVTPACDAGSPNGKPDAMEILPADVTIGIGDTLLLNAIGIFGEGEDACRASLAGATQNTVWKVLEGESVSVDDNGRVTGLACGVSTVEAKFRGEDATTTVTVDDDSCP